MHRMNKHTTPPKGTDHNNLILVQAVDSARFDYNALHISINTSTPCDGLNMMFVFSYLRWAYVYLVAIRAFTWASWTLVTSSPIWDFLSMLVSIQNTKSRLRQRAAAAVLAKTLPTQILTFPTLT